MLWTLLCGNLYAAENAVPSVSQSKPTTVGEDTKESQQRIFLRESSILLKPGEREMDISLNYSRHQASEIRMREATMTMAVRLGLATWLEMFAELPFIRADREIIKEEGVQTPNAMGMGDISTGIKCLLVRETPRRPDIIASLNVNIPTGTSPNPLDPAVVALGSGQWQTSTKLTFVKSSDPIVLFGGIGYAYIFEKTLHNVNVDSAHALYYDLGIGLAINSQITLTGQFAGNYRPDIVLDGKKAVGSAQEPMTAMFGMSYCLSKTQYFEPSVTVGVNDDATDAMLSFHYIHTF